MWITVGEYSKKFDISRQAVYKRIKSKTLKTRMSKDKKTLVFVNEQKKEARESVLSSIPTNEIISDSVKEILDKFEKSHKREIEGLNKIIKMQEHQILELNAEIKYLRSNNK